MIAVLSAAAVVFALAVSAAVRVSARSSDVVARPLPAPPAALAPPRPPAPATVPPPPPIVVAELPTPFCWGCRHNEDAPLEFQVDLDLLAPLGDGSSNAAPWFEQFARDDSDDYRERRIEITIDGQEWKVLPGNDPLLLEAEPWIEQATMSFYPEVWEFRGFDTQFPDLLMTLDLARSWVVRGKLSDDFDSAREDFQRAIRLGRLLRQDDFTIIQDLVAIACIRLGAEAIYDLARNEGNAATMTVAALVMADKDAMRQRTARRITTLERAFRIENPDAATMTLRLNDAELDSIIELIREIPERRFLGEGLVGMHTVMHVGTPAQQQKARAVLAEFSASDDELAAEMARYFLASEFDADALLEVLK
jgi:hypothetical protein